MDETWIKLTCAAIDEQGTEIVLRGVIDPSSLTHLRVAEYQREILPERRIGSLMAALQKGGVPDIQLGCRGGNYIEEAGGVFYVKDPTYIIDGLQRRTAALKLVDKGIMPRIGAVVSFNTTEELERHRFRALNVTRVKLSPNVLLRNLRHESPAIQALHQLCLSSQFVLYKRVSWQQRMKREELMSAMTLLFSCTNLHARFGVGLTQRSMQQVVKNIDMVYNKIGRGALMSNTRTFWETIDKAFNLRDVVYKDASAALRTGFIVTCAQVIAGHEDFWNDTELSVPPELQKKLGTFPLADPSIRLLAAASNSGTVLRQLIVNHLNSGKRTKHLRPFTDAPYYTEPAMAEA